MGLGLQTTAEEPRSPVIHSQDMRVSTLLAVSAAVRLLLVVWGELQDRFSPVPFTDIDYVVFTDAARFAAQGQSPYQRSTYRYSPLVAYLLLPNIWVHPVWGKLLFSAADIWVGLVTSRIVRRLGGSAGAATVAAAAWLYNPYTLTISTRGSCDVLVAALLLGVLQCLLHQDAMGAAVLYGLAVHLRVYPIIYAPSLVLFLAARSIHKTAARKAKKSGQPSPEPQGVPAPTTLKGLDAYLTHVTLHGMLFGGLSGGVFLLLGAVFRQLYGEQFVNEAFLHHLGRKDPRHNFSIYFYNIYLTYFSPSSSPTQLGGATTLDAAATVAAATAASAMPQQLDPLSAAFAQLEPWLSGLSEPAVLAFVPQVVLLVAISLKLHHDLPLCWLALTMAFVALNKVCTAQYFVWWLFLLPLVLHHVARPVPKGLLAAAGLWVAAQLHWLAWAYLLEFRGRPVYMGVWAAGLVFLASNVLLLAQLLISVQPAKSFLAYSVMQAAAGGEGEAAEGGTGGEVAAPGKAGEAPAAAAVGEADQAADAGQDGDVDAGAAAAAEPTARTLRQRRGRQAA